MPSTADAPAATTANARDDGTAPASLRQRRAESRPAQDPVQATAAHRAAQGLQRKGLQVSRCAIFNLVFFSILIFAVPLGVFFYGLENWFQGNPTYAGFAAAAAANVVVVLFVVVAFAEGDDGDDAGSQGGPASRAFGYSPAATSAGDGSGVGRPGSASKKSQ
ncbi:hypothetical protein HK105_206225 [Polyrhizophydium stewartii]|uniref:Vacuolar ATPase assembly integral membrane protein VMA21 n=1 Tax=Polyrhizophydium stewartii TaxID=2732419 RepID=A0ABR4N472_9FUNG